MSNSNSPSFLVKPSHSSDFLSEVIGIQVPKPEILLDLAFAPQCPSVAGLCGADSGPVCHSHPGGRLGSLRPLFSGVSSSGPLSHLPCLPTATRRSSPKTSISVCPSPACKPPPAPRCGRINSKLFLPSCNPWVSYSVLQLELLPPSQHPSPLKYLLPFQNRPYALAHICAIFRQAGRILQGKATLLT